MRRSNVKCLHFAVSPVPEAVTLSILHDKWVKDIVHASFNEGLNYYLSLKVGHGDNNYFVL